MMHNSKNLTSELLIKYIGITDSTIGNWKMVSEVKHTSMMR